MDQPIERLHIVYAVPQGGLVTCPADQQPLHVQVVYSGRQQECERYMRDTARYETRRTHDRGGAPLPNTYRHQS